MINERAKAILEFCFIKTPLEQWFKKDDEFDNILKSTFMDDYNKAINNEYDNWRNNAEECVALIILLDQLSRNFFRNNSFLLTKSTIRLSIFNSSHTLTKLFFLIFSLNFLTLFFTFVFASIVDHLLKISSNASSKFFFVFLTILSTLVIKKPNEKLISSFSISIIKLLSSISFSKISLTNFLLEKIAGLFLFKKSFFSINFLFPIFKFSFFNYFAISQTI